MGERRGDPRGVPRGVEELTRAARNRNILVTATLSNPDETQRLLRPVGRRHRSHQRFRGRRHRDRAQAPREDRQRVRGTKRHHRRADRGPDRHEPRAVTRDPGTQEHPGRSVRVLPLQAQELRRGPRAVRAAARRVSRARHRLFLLQRRQRLRRHLSQGIADRGAHGLSADRRARAQNGRQRSAGHRLLPRLWLGRQVRRDVDARGRVRCGLDGEDVDPRVRARGHGAKRGLDHGGGGPFRRQGHADPARSAVSGDPVRRSEVPRGGRREREAAWLLLRRRLRGPQGFDRAG